MDDQPDIMGGAPTQPISPTAPAAEAQAAPRHSSSGKWWLWPLTIALLLTVILLPSGEKEDKQEQRLVASGMTVPAPHADLIIVLGKIFIAAKDLLVGQEQEQILVSLDAQAKQSKSAAERFRIALLAGELAGAEALADRLEKLKPDLAEDSPIWTDIGTVEAIYAQADGQSRAPVADDAAEATDTVLPPTTEAIKQLESRHGWFGRLAASHAKGPADPFRQATERDGWILIGIFATVGGLLLLSFLAGLGLLILGIVLAAQGRLRPALPRPPGGMTPEGGRGVWFETLAVFLLGFLLLRIGATVIHANADKDADWPLFAQLLLQWPIALTILWPLARGMSWQQFRHDIGWHTGRGFWREVGAGLAAYLAAVPLYCFLAVVIAIWLLIKQAIRKALTGEEGGGPGPNRILELASSGGPWLIVLLFLLATIWAPFVEEAIFRGALYRHLRGRVGMIAAALGSATVFAALHGYMVEQLFLVGLLGFTFALMREWRGSLIGSMTAHAVHNATVLALLIALLSLADG